MTTFSNKPSHLKALLKKNWILWKRSWCVSLLEILVPILFASTMLSLRGAVPQVHIEQHSYFDNPYWMFQYDGTLDATDEPFFKACTAAKNEAMIALVPEGDSLIEDLKNMFETDLNLKTRYFKSVDEINAFTGSKDYSTSPELNLCFGVIVNKNNVDDKYEYSLMFNTSKAGGEEDIPNTNANRIKEIVKQNLDSLGKYGYNGFLVVQNMIDNLILRRATGNSAAQIQSDATSVIVEAHIVDDLAAGMRGQARLYLDLPLLLPYLRLINGIVREKETKIREGMKIMGLSNSAFYLSWLITYSIIFTLISAFVAQTLAFAFFKLSSFGLIFLWHLEFAICVMALGFFITVFFNKAKQANVAGLVIFLLLGFFQYIGNAEGATTAAIIGSSIAPPASVGLSVDHILSLEAAQLGLTSDTANIEISGYRMTYHYVIMALDVLVLFLLGTYLDQILPSEFGVRKHPLFCLMRKKKSSDKARISQSRDEQKDILETQENSENFEETDPTLKLQDQANESIMVEGLRKVFSSGKIAVDHLSFSMYKSQIFALLGHNGAGKTTTISMLTGLINSTEGTTKIFGMDNQTHLDEIRKTMGVCPQHDVLFDKMTVKEHLELFAVFKGVNSKDISQEVEKTIQEIGLSDKRDYLSKNLSGGQKRKLSIGIAFIGGSKFIVLDEPSSGMDTSARRKLWDMLKNYKNNRVVLLTTHFMDEADYLGDRIGIMGEGKLKCLGRPLFLKSKFGAGYNLTLVKKDINDPSAPITDLVLGHVKEAKVSSDVSAEVALQLPLDTTPKFEKLFEDLDKNLERLKVSSYGISVTTLEEVFLNVAKITTPDKHFSREIENDATDNYDLDEFDLRKQGIKNSLSIFKTHFAALVVKRVQYFKRDKRGLVCEIFLPIIMIIAGILLGKIEFNKVGSPLPLADNLYDYKFEVDYNSIVPTGGAAIDTNFINEFNPSAFNMVPKSANSLAEFNQAVFDSQGKDTISSPVNVFSFYMDTFDPTAKSYKYTAFINTRAQEGSAFALNKINNAILRSATGNDRKEITAIVSSFEKTQGVKTMDKVAEGITFAFVFSMGMSFIPASIITFIVKERELNAKHQQIVSGVSLLAYWFANYFVDIAKYLIPAIVNSLLAMAFDASALIEGQKLGGLWTIFILYGFAVTSFVYLLSFFFKDYGKAQIVSFFFNFCTGFLGSVIVSILRLFTSTMAVAKIMHWILRVLPTFSMTYGFLNLANREAYSAIEKRDQVIDVFDADLVLGDILYLLGGAVVYLGLVLIIEKLRNIQWLSTLLTREKNVPYVPKETDDDVRREELEVESSKNNAYAIKVDKLRKVYALGKKKYKVAVDQVSFGVKNGECFALLGVNGAGKTTTFKILSGDYVQTSGKAFINGLSIPGQMDKARKDIGYCPQFDALLENLTAKEHLNLYAAIKGIPGHLRARLVEKQLREMNLKQYENIPAGTYSGGNKRKLSVAIAMIGNPAVVFLDEPSTGMDPEARRFMWNVISRISRERKQSSVILTTHSMEEAEALATKMGIMVDGNLKCLGTSQHIKNKFGGGYEIEVKLNLPTKDHIEMTLKSLNCSTDQSIDDQRVNEILDQLELPSLKNELCDEGSGSHIYVELKKGTVSVSLLIEWVLIEANGVKLKRFLEDNFGEMTVLEHFQSFFRFKATNVISVGKFFGSFEANKTSLNVMQYSIRQSTIEQIFNNFANQQVSVQPGIQTEIQIINN